MRPYLEVACFADVIRYNEAGDWTEVAASQGLQATTKTKENSVKYGLP